MLRLACDIDGVLARFDEAFIRIINELYPEKALPATHAPYHWDDWGLTDDETSRVWRRIKATPNFWTTLRPYHGAIEDLSTFLSFQTSPMEFYYVTSRVQTCGDSALDQTRWWLEDQCRGLERYPVIVVERGNDKAKLYKVLGIQYSVDDNYDNFSNAFGLPKHESYLYSRSWNSERPDFGRRVSTLNEYFEKVLASERGRGVGYESRTGYTAVEVQSNTQR